MPPVLRCAAASPPPQRKLHNFTFPTGTWGTQRFLRCTKSPPGSDTKPHGSVASTANPDGCTSSRRQPYAVEKTVPPAKQSVRDRYLFKEEKRAEQVTTGRSCSSIVVAAPTVEDAREHSRPRKQRSRRAGCNAQVEKDGPLSPLAIEKRCLQTEGQNGTLDRVEEKRHQKFSLSLSREEIEQGFLTLKGTEPSARPKKRPRIVQQQLDSLFPGLLLGDITPARYKVN